jgi:hypothetical protein
MSKQGFITLILQASVTYCMCPTRWTYDQSWCTTGSHLDNQTGLIIVKAINKNKFNTSFISNLYIKPNQINHVLKSEFITVLVVIGLNKLFRE